MNRCAIKCGSFLCALVTSRATPAFDPAQAALSIVEGRRAAGRADMQSLWNLRNLWMSFGAGGHS